MRLYILFCLFALVYLQDPPKLPIYAGVSYDLLTGNPLSNQVDPGFQHSIFQFTYNDKQTTQDGKYLIPDGVSHRKVSSCTFSTDVQTYRGTDSYQKQLKTKATISGGYKGVLLDAAFSTSATYQQISKSTVESNMSITHATASCQAYELSIDIFTTVKLLPNFIAGAVQSYRTKKWDKFITQFGTHFIYDVTMGGRATQEITYDFQSVSTMSANDIDIQIAAKASYAKFFVDGSFDWKKHEEDIAYAEKLSKTMTELYIGGIPPKNGTINDWAEKVIENPMPIKYKVIELSQLFDKIQDSTFDSDAAQKQFMDALDAYCTSVACKKPSPDKPKPPPATISMARSFAHGGGGGGPYEFYINSTTMNAVKFLIRHSSRINSLQILFGDGVKKMFSPQQGMYDGQYDEWTVPDGQYVSQIQFKSGDCEGQCYVDGINFVTNTGLKSPYYGGGGGGYTLETIPDGYRIIGFYGRAGGYVDRLGFIYGKTVYPPNSQPYLHVIKKELRTQ